MTSLAPLITLIFCLAGALSTTGWSTAAEQPSADENLQVARTIERHFAGFSGYREGDLICRSQVEELQRYLRRTRGHIPATHRRLLNQVLADNAFLCRLFFSERGEAVLAAAAKKLSGYADLDSISRLETGRDKIKEAIRSGQPDVLIEYVEQEMARRSSGQSRQPNVPEASTGYARIYTVEQLIKASLAPSGPNELPSGS
jgi:hypothetical protein